MDSNMRWVQLGLTALGATGALLVVVNWGKCHKSKNDARPVIRVGTRKSPLAMVQTRFVIAELKKHLPNVEFEILEQSTKGDEILDKPLAKIGDKGLFTSELEAKMHSGAIDIAVHSCKDLQTTLPDGLCIGAFLERHPREDVFIVNKSLQGRVRSVAELPPGSVVGTSSLRRRAMLAHKHPHLTFKDIRGNIGTRLGKLDNPDNGYDATILAHAGLLRMDTEEYTSRLTQVLDESEYMYAVAQGVLAVECRAEDRWILDDVLSHINHKPTQQEAEAERGLLRGLEGGCHVPLSARCNRSADGKTLRLDGAVLSLDGRECIEDTLSGPATAATALGHRLAESLCTSGAKTLLQSLHAENKS
eukprot:TRINITY_DN43948_c0_g1_i1.p1 TRINITY_DN43948_c0_g1~~TRINITY_DN43948_c0_g1_i1.p1  ORF type:complete len:371 (+),score=156.93 TRINITY_DN43948_c0_g1_i1:32-1114(+)